MSEDRAAFTGLPTRPYEAGWRFELPLLPAEPVRLDVETGTDGTVPFERVGFVDVPGIGTLDVWQLASYGGGLFVPVRDALAGAKGGTYGGGRYLLDTVKGADLGSGHADLVLDFNFAYNPSCAYDPAWACPLEGLYAQATSLPSTFRSASATLEPTKGSSARVGVLARPRRPPCVVERFLFSPS